MAAEKRKGKHRRKTLERKADRGKQKDRSVSWGDPASDPLADLREFARIGGGDEND